MITREDFELYEAVREIRKVNMFDIKYIEDLTGLEKEKLIDIMDNYGDYKEKYINN